ncbi:hypothetical protein MMC07_004279 [Pseudocyphellaria aurata]|nr:hypothetical protein [Pseudocyphellaria aurata]
MPRPRPRESDFSDSELANDDETFSDDEHRRDSYPQPQPYDAARSSSHRSPRGSFEEPGNTELRTRRRRNEPSWQTDDHSEPDNNEEPPSPRWRAAPESRVREHLNPHRDEYRPQSTDTSDPADQRRLNPGRDVDDEELQRVLKASLAAQKAQEQRMRRREEEIAAREAADEAIAIAASARLATNPTAAQLREVNADAELQRILRESRVEAEEKEAREKAELASLHARFGASGAQQPTSGSSRNSAPSASGQRARANSGLRSPAPLSPRHSDSPDLAPREPAASSTERLMSAGNNLLRRGLELARKPSVRATPAVQQPRRAAPARLADISPYESESEQPPAVAPRSNPLRAAGNPPRAPSSPTPDSPSAGANRPRARPDHQRAGANPPVAPATSMSDPEGAAANHPGAPQNAPGARTNPTRAHASPRRRHPNALGRRSSERAPHVDRLPVARASSTSRRDRGRAINYGELDPSIRQALNNSERWARMEQGRGGHSLREEEQMRIALQNSLGDAPLPPDPIEGLIDPPPAYHNIGRDKKLDPLRYTTTNEKGNEPGYKRSITPEILASMKKFLLQQQKFDEKAKAAGNDLPPANNATAKKQKRGPVVESSAVTIHSSSADSAPEIADSLENMLGTRLPPAQLARGTPTNRAGVSSNENAFVSRMPGLASNARERLPQSRPWDNAFSRLPRDRRRLSGRP